MLLKISRSGRPVIEGVAQAMALRAGEDCGKDISLHQAAEILILTNLIHSMHKARIAQYCSCRETEQVRLFMRLSKIYVE